MGFNQNWEREKPRIDMQITALTNILESQFFTRVFLYTTKFLFMPALALEIGAIFHALGLSHQEALVTSSIVIFNYCQKHFVGSRATRTPILYPVIRESVPLCPSSAPLYFTNQPTTPLKFFLNGDLTNNCLELTI